MICFGAMVRQHSVDWIVHAESIHLLGRSGIAVDHPQQVYRLRLEGTSPGQRPVSPSSEKGVSHMHASTARQRYRRLVPLGWSGYLAVMAGTVAVAATLVAWAGGHVLAALIAAGAALILFAGAGGAYTVSKRTADDPALQRRMRRLRHAKYRSAYPADPNSRGQ